VKAVLLVGGLGTRLRPLTFSIPKPLLPIGETPILQIIIERLRDAGICEIVLATGYQAELIQAFCGDGSKFGVTVGYVKEEHPLGTAGPLSLVRDRVTADEYFILMNGDILTDIDFRKFLEFAQSRGCELTVGYTTYTYRSPFGVLTVREDRVESVVEKPSHEYVISAGIYCLKGTALQWIPDGEFFTMPDLIRRFIDDGRPIGAYPIRAAWMGLESITHFEEAIRALDGVPLDELPGARKSRRSSGAQ
jgi:NDP-sugar pyrophosphorylase family protein